jgi:hypothetical protein
VNGQILSNIISEENSLQLSEVTRIPLSNTAEIPYIPPSHAAENHDFPLGNTKEIVNNFWGKIQR